jgi:PPOX class probable F420-dependent enzyme
METRLWERSFIDRQRVARLSTVDAKGWPHIVPIVFVFDGRRLFTPIDNKPKRVKPGQLQRVRDIQGNPQVAVLFDEYDEDWHKLAWVQIRGMAVFLESGPDRETGIALLEARYPQYSTLPLAESPVIVITVQDLVSWKAA